MYVKTLLLHSWKWQMDVHLYPTEPLPLLLTYLYSYPDYEFISDPSATLSAGLNRRYSDESLRGVILDIHFLSLCDHLVCTFSSQVRITD